MSFALDLKAFANKTNEKCQLIVSKIVLDVGTRVVEKSPVGNPDLWAGWNPGGVSKNENHWLVKAGFVHEGYVGGRFRANWQYGRGAANTGTSEEVDASGQVSINRFVEGSGEKPAGHVHYITNSLPYAIPLENGHSSKQAPQGMVGLTVLEFQPIVKAAAAAVQ